MEKSKDRAAALFNTLPRNIKNVPLIDALMGRGGADLLDAIFEVEVLPEHVDPLFSGEDNYFERAQILTQQSASVVAGNEPAESVHSVKQTPDGTLKKDQLDVPPSGGPSPMVTPSQTLGASSNRLQKQRTPTPMTRQGPLMTFEEEAQTNFSSPLSRLFSKRAPSRPLDFSNEVGPGSASAGIEEAVVGIRKMEGLLEAMKEDKNKVPVQQLRADVKELQVSIGCRLILSIPFTIITGTSSEN